MGVTVGVEISPKTTAWLAEIGVTDATAAAGAVGDAGGLSAEPRPIIRATAMTAVPIDSTMALSFKPGRGNVAMLWLAGDGLFGGRRRVIPRAFPEPI